MIAEAAARLGRVQERVQRIGDCDKFTGSGQQLGQVSDAAEKLPYVDATRKVAARAPARAADSCGLAASSWR